ncbi:MAG: GreA/GreB family elongation factor [Actinomycetota bacterium]|nr:GreA/GreB family elongation factor [Actinomycetota bacterium]
MNQPTTTAASHGGPDATTYVMSEPALAAHEDELARLRARKTGEVAEQLRDARSFGDAAGNDELWAIREDEAILDARIARLEEIIARSRVVATDTSTSGAAIGSVVDLEDVATGEIARYRIVAVHDAVAERGITPVSAASPVGRAIIGQAEGAHVSVELPGGRTRELRLVRVQAEPQTDGLAAAS